MNKKLIRLTESDLHKIVKESVNQVLTELDWRTYTNAVQKAREQGRYSRWDFDRATERALDKQYGGHHLVGTDNEKYQDIHTYNDAPCINPCCAGRCSSTLRRKSGSIART